MAFNSEAEANKDAAIRLNKSGIKVLPTDYPVTALAMLAEEVARLRKELNGLGRQVGSMGGYLYGPKL